MAVTGHDVADFLGKRDVATVIEHAEIQLPTVTAFVRAYTGGRGFTDGEPDDDVAAVIVSATARLVTNPTLTIHEAAGAFSVRHGTFDGWTLPELAVLHRHRRRSA